MIASVDKGSELAPGKIIRPALAGLALLWAGEAKAQAAFKHPGVLVTKEQLDFVKQKIQSGTQPWKAAYDRMKASEYASTSYSPKPRTSVDCGSYSNPDYGCSDEKNDVTAAYTQALLYQLTGNEQYAQKAAQIMNAWSAVLKTHTLSNAPLQSAWCASIFPRAAELIRYTYKGWSQSDIDRFSQMLKTAYLPYIQKGSSTTNGNWELSMIEGTMDCAVFLDDHAMFDQALAMWRKRVPEYFYLASDGALPNPPPDIAATDKTKLVSYWYNQSTFVDGLAQETCRDFGHTEYGIASTINAAETALIQGVNLYQEQTKRITAAMEFHANYLMAATTPSWLCGGTLTKSFGPTWEIGYNHFHTRLGMDLPKSKALIESKLRPTDANHQMVWETLTTAEVGSVGIAAGTSLAQAPKQTGSRRVGILFREAGNFQVTWEGRDGRMESYGMDGAAVSARLPM